MFGKSGFIHSYFVFKQKYCIFAKNIYDETSSQKKCCVSK